MLDGMQPSSSNVANTIVQRDSSGNFSAGTVTATLNGNASTATKLQTARTISLSGDVSGSTSFDGSSNVAITTTLANSGVTAGTYTKVTVDSKGRVTSGSLLSASDIPPLDMSKITSGNLATTRLSEPSYVTGSITGTARPLFDVLRADRTVFLPASQIIIEKSTDGGVTWEDAGVSDTVKQQLFTGQRPAIAIPLKDGVKNTDCMIRVTITGMRYNVPSGTPETEKYNYWNSNYVLSTERYFSAEEAWIWVSSNADRIYCKVERATGANPTNWVVDREAFMSGWSGGNYISLSESTFGGGTAQTSNYWNWRFTFRTATTSNDFDNAKLNQTYLTTPQFIYHIKIGGKNVWVVPNKLMYHDHIYSWDEDQNVTFPAKVTATNFYVGSNIVWHAGNDGSGSSLDADLLDGYHADTGTTASTIPVRDASGNLPGNITGNAATATKLQTARTISLTGDATGSASFDGSSNVAIAATLANSGVTAGTYTKVTVDVKGRVTSGTTLSVSDIPSHKSTHASGGSDVLTPADIGAVNKAGDTMTGALTVPNLVAKIGIPSSSGPSAWPVGFVAGVVYNNGYPVSYGTIFSYKGTSGNSCVQILQAWPGTDGGEAYLYIRSARDVGTDVFGPWRKVWSENNDGSGSGLDADLLDGQHASAFASATHNHDSSYVIKAGFSRMTVATTAPTSPATGDVWIDTSV